MKRILIQYTQGPLKGVTQIVGEADSNRYPAAIEGPFQVGGIGPQVEFASLIKVEPRYVLYREIVKPAARNQFGHPMQFDPRQA